MELGDDQVGDGDGHAHQHRRLHRCLESRQGDRQPLAVRLDRQGRPGLRHRPAALEMALGRAERAGEAAHLRQEQRTQAGVRQRRLPRRRGGVLPRGPGALLRLVPEVQGDHWRARRRGRLHETVHGRLGRRVHDGRAHVQAGRQPPGVRGRQVRGVPPVEDPRELAVLHRPGQWRIAQHRVRPVQRPRPQLAEQGLAELSQWPVPGAQVEWSLSSSSSRARLGERAALCAFADQRLTAIPDRRLGH
mmetsp:Transcript_95187/g.186809  ORF Transcript_95187/g.186809 Transcript_95187/m.186809 type:complete len:247 (-) Transcript_95187:9-749(-)